MIPLAMAAEIRGPQFFDGGVNWITILARLKTDQTLQAATAALRAAQPSIREAARPAADRNSTLLKNPLVLMPAERGNSLDPLRLRAKRPLFILQLIMLLVLLIACANIANLALAHGVSRRHEFALKLTLGASRWKIAQQLFIESLILAALGVLAAVPLSQWLLRVLIRFFATLPAELTLNTSPDLRIAMFTATIAVVTLVTIGLLPAARAARVEPTASLKEVRAKRLGGASGFVVAQVALSLLVIVGGGLLIRSYANLAMKNPGFDPSGILVVDVGTRKARVPPANRLNTFEQVRQTVATAPGVAGAAFADLSPIAGGAMLTDIAIVGEPPTAGSRETFFNRVSPGWLSIYRTPILSGRDFTTDDRPGSLRVAIVNRAFVRQFLGSADAIGRAVRQLQGPPGRPPMEWVVIGVVADAAYGSLRETAPPTMYLAFDQIDAEMLAMAAPVAASMSVRVSGAAPLAVTKSIAAAAAQVNPALDLTFRTLTDIVEGSTRVERTLALLSGLASFLSILLAAIGLYGVTSYNVNRDRKDISIRIALGATRGAVVRQTLMRVTVIVSGGILLGIAASMWASQLVAALLVGVQPRDPLTLSGATLILLSIGVFAAWLPARRASRD